MWALRYEKHAEEAFRLLDKSVQRRIAKYMAGICGLEAPELRGKPMRGDLAGHWRYRVGAYRVVCRFEHGQMIVIVVTLGHRSTVYE